MKIRSYLALFLATTSLASATDCTRVEHSVSEHVREYGIAIKTGQFREAELLHRRNQALLNFVRPQAECFRKAVETYAFASLTLVGGHSDFSVSDFWRRILRESEVIRPITPEFRRDRGGEWLKSPSESAFSIYGAYDCGETRIYVDPTLAPIDLASTLAHEIDHLLRDKLRAETNAPVPSEILADEFLGALRSAYLQFELFDASTNNIREKGLSLSMENLTEWWDQRSNRLRFDMTLYDRNGLFRKFYLEHRDEIPDTVHGPTALSSADGLFQSLASITHFLFDRGTSFETLVVRMLERVRTVYFPNGDATMGSETWSTLRNLTWERDPIFPREKRGSWGSKTGAAASLEEKIRRGLPTAACHAEKSRTSLRKLGGEGSRPTRPLRMCINPKNSFI